MKTIKFFTSISPKHHNVEVQKKAIATMLIVGDVVSLNHPSEIDVLVAEYPNVQFVETRFTFEQRFEKPLVGISAVMNEIKSQPANQLCCIINSDIMLVGNFPIDTVVDIAGKGVLYLHRWDLDDKNELKLYNLGVDAMFFYPECANLIPQTTYCFGQTYWDLYYPWAFAMAGFQIYSITDEPMIIHKVHPAQYKPEHWEAMGKYTAFLTGRNQSPAETSKYLYSFLRQITIFKPFKKIDNE